MKYGKGLTRIISIKVVSLAYELMFEVYAQLGSLAALGLLLYPEVFFPKYCCYVSEVTTSSNV